MSTLLSQHIHISKPLFDPLITDEFTRIIIITISLVITIFSIAKIMRYYDE